jgi:hypothetical protein
MGIRADYVTRASTTGCANRPQPALVALKAVAGSRAATASTSAERRTARRGDACVL